MFLGSTFDFCFPLLPRRSRRELL